MRKLPLTALLAMGVQPALAGTLALSSTVLDRDRIVPVVYRMANAITGTGTLKFTWTDSLGRIVEDRTVPIELTDEDQFSFAIDLRRAVAMKNTLKAHFSIDGRNLKGAEHRQDDAQIDFIARPPGREWNDYAIIMWQQYERELQPVLKTLGINGGQFSGRVNSLPDLFIDNNLRWYSENIGTDFYSEYHRYRPDRIQNWSFLQAKEMYQRDPSSKEAFKRHPSFWDPVWRKTIHDRLVEAVKRNSPYRPFFYSLGDESGIADLAAFWDFDFSDESLVEMRRWLRTQYSSLAALNREWGTKFANWDSVTPPTTHEAMQRQGDNFSAWADFKQWMDISYANALGMGTDAVHEVDPDAYVGIGGGQMPGWGGYDYARLTQAITAIEPYDIGNNVEIIRSLNPRMPMLSTGFASGDWEKHRVWRELFHGHRGLIIWDEKHEYAAGGKPGQRGEEAGRYYNELRDGIGALIINSLLKTDPIAIHYSQASMRTEWMLARRPEGDEWIKRQARIERTDNDFMRLRESWCRLIEDEGLQYKFLSYGQLEQGELAKGGYRVLVLPRSSSLSDAEAQAIRDFVRQGGMAIADGEPGIFNERSRRLEKSRLEELFGGAHEQPVTERKYGSGKAVFLKADTLNYHQNRLVKKEGPVQSLIGNLLTSNGVEPEFAVRDASGKPVAGVEVQVFENGGVRLIALLSNPQLRVDELGPPDFRSNERFDKPVSFTLSLAKPMLVYDVRKRAPLGEKQKLSLTLTPYEPLVFAVSPVHLPELKVSVPTQASRGHLVEIGISNPRTPAAMYVVHVDARDPSGKRVIDYSGNILASHGVGKKLLPLAVNDMAGRWTIRVHDLLSGQQQNLTLDVH